MYQFKTDKDLKDLVLSWEETGYEYSYSIYEDSVDTTDFYYSPNFQALICPSTKQCCVLPKKFPGMVKSRKQIGAKQ